MTVITLLDTGPLVAVLDRTDAAHDWSSNQLRSLRGSLVTCSAVISETMFLLRRQHAAAIQLQQFIERSAIIPFTEDAQLWSDALKLMERYKNVPMSFADACLVACADQIQNAQIFTLDRDFLIYRRN